MLKVLIVDDEMLVRANMRMMIDWVKLGFTICGEASNGKEALMMIDAHNPDIVILDIKMPEMDGYQLSNVICQKYKSIKMIVLSNYDDFEYVRGTLKNGALDYILKHNLNKDTLIDALKRVKDSLPDTNTNTSGLKTLNNVIALREKFVLQLLTGFYKNEEEIRKQLELLEINLGCHNILPVVMEIDDYEIVTRTNSNILKEKSLLEYAIINITEELLNENRNGVVTHISDKMFSILLSFSSIHSQAQVINTSNSILSTISSCLNKFLEISVSFSIGTLCPGFNDIPKSYEYAVDCLKNKFYMGKSCIINNAEKAAPSEDLSGLSLTVEKQILNHLKTGDSGSLMSSLEALFTGIKNASLSITGARMVFYDLLHIIINTCKEKDIEMSAVFSGNNAPHDMLAKIDTIDESRSWIISLFKKLIELCNVESNNYNSEYVRKAVSFIRKNYSKNISLSDAADEIGIISPYLSKLFKDEVGIGFAEYLGNLRIEKAKALLEDGSYEIKDIISLCGFGSYDYFIKSFKKKVGVTPSKYLRE